ncbi:MAG: protein kinase, partial [Myxococcales bacterium]|nr:protein kinase [Myxococcales bacterium]
MVSSFDDKQSGDDVPEGSADLRRQISSMHVRAPVGSGPLSSAELAGPKTIDRYRVIEELATGGMGELYIAWDDRLDRRVAIKLVQPQHHREIADQRLLREAKVLGQISHPNVVGVYEVGVHEGRVFVVMEYVQGRTMRAWLEGLKLSGAARALAVLAHYIAAGRGLQAVHEAG